MALLLVGVSAAAPVVFGLQRLAMADDAMGASLPRGSYVLVRRVPVRATAARHRASRPSGPPGRGFRGCAMSEVVTGTFSLTTCDSEETRPPPTCNNAGAQWGHATREGTAR